MVRIGVWVDTPRSWCLSQEGLLISDGDSENLRSCYADVCMYMAAYIPATKYKGKSAMSDHTGERLFLINTVPTQRTVPLVMPQGIIAPGHEFGFLFSVSGYASIVPCSLGPLLPQMHQVLHAARSSPSLPLDPSHADCCSLKLVGAESGCRLGATHTDLS